MSSESRKNRELRNELKTKPCVVCGRLPSDPCHIKTFKVSQSDHPLNMISLCRMHHIEQHKSWADFLRKYPHVQKLLESMGWEVIDKVDGGVYLVHPEIK